MPFDMPRGPLSARSAVVLAALVVTFVWVPALSAQRLPSTVVPEHYALSLTPDLQAETFDGEVRIRVKLLEPTSRIVLHAAGLNVISAGITAGQQIYGATVVPDPGSETITLTIPTGIGPGDAELVLSYRGRLTRTLRGLYISEANDRKYAVTQLQATDARRMFPAFDEPRFKATFDIQVTVDAGDTAISNGSAETVRPAAAGKRIFDFATTRPMSTYLVALAIGDFECRERLVGKTPLRVCATPGNAALTDFAMQAAEASLDYLNRYFLIEYPFQKLDLVAIPDFAAGAMENTGAVFFREALLLVESDAALSVRKRAAAVIAHELAHMWFGNLVTMTWWDDLWLNEGFATWMEAKIIGAWQAEWDVELDELQATHRVMAVDSRRSTRAIRTAVETPAEIEALFDPIAYDKTAAVLGMVESFVGAEAWQRGLNAYLQEFQFANAAAEDFWRVMTRVTEKPVDRIMASFVTRPGLPLVTVETACTANETMVSVSQQRFSTSGPQPAEPWTVPVCFETRGDADADSCLLLDSRSARETWPGCRTWVVGNAGAEGYYRTAHGPAALDRLIRANAELAADERLMLVDDQWALVRSDGGDVSAFLHTTAALAGDVRAPLVLGTVGARLRYIHEYLATEDTRPAFERWVRERFQPMLEHTDKILTHSETLERRRAALISIVGAVGRDPQVLAKAADEVRRYLEAPATNPLGPDVLDVYIGLAAVTGDAGLYDAYRKRAEAAETPAERYRFLYGLTMFRDELLAHRTFDYALSASVRAQDRALLLGRMLANPAIRDLTWRQMQTYWSQLQAGVGAFGGTTRLIEALGAFCDRQRLNEIEAFFAKHPVPGAARTLSQTVEDIESCAALAESDRSDLSEVLSTRR
jgi:puromycin-sensitive aminopeptidase